jgi:DNA repair photolyase
MKLNPSAGNMYDFITHTANAIKGACVLHDCSYCYMKRWGKLRPVRLDEKELRTPMTEGNFIFVGSSCDMFAENIPEDWITRTIEHCKEFDNNYLFQSKNPANLFTFHRGLPRKSVICTTIETNRWLPDIMRNSPKPEIRADAMNEIANCGYDTYVTIEPIMDFDLGTLVNMIDKCLPKQCNIGADSGNNKLPEPLKEKIIELIAELEKFTVVKQKKNLSRLLK